MQPSTMTSPLLILVLALSAALATPYTFNDDDTVIISQKRAGLLLDRLLTTLREALREGGAPPWYGRAVHDGWSRRADDMSVPQRRGEDSSSMSSSNKKSTFKPCYFKLCNPPGYN